MNFLLNQEKVKQLEPIRSWSVVSWSFLTLGISLGSWWAYYELGWGGWWFWDPVENSALVPWLLCTALIHSSIATNARQIFINWTLALTILSLAGSLLGMFLVRSGSNLSNGLERKTVKASNANKTMFIKADEYF